MKIVKKIPIWAIIFIFLLVFNLIWMLFNSYQHAGLRMAGKQFKIEVLHTNDVSGIGIFEANTGQPLWIEWNNNHTGKPDAISYFLDGANIFNLHLKEGRPPAYDVIFHGSGKSQTWWWDLRKGTFMTRIFYDTNGDFLKQEVWYNQVWNTIERQNGTNGIIFNGAWHPLVFDTNGMWTTEVPTIESTNHF